MLHSRLILIPSSNEYLEHQESFLRVSKLIQKTITVLYFFFQFETKKDSDLKLLTNFMTSWKVWKKKELVAKKKKCPPCK